LPARLEERVATNAVTERRSVLTDEQVEHRLKFPEGVEAIEGYRAIQARYRGLL
jgi:hypothetical protein